MILDVRWPLLFFSETDFINNYLHIVQKWTKKPMWEVTKISRFLSTGYGILPSWAARRVKLVAKCELVLWGTSPVRLIGPFKPYLAENVSLQSSNCNILGLAATVAFFDNEDRFTQISVFFRACSLQNEVGDPPFFYISDITNSSSFNQKKMMLENFRANVLKKVTLAKATNTSLEQGLMEKTAS